MSSTEKYATAIGVLIIVAAGAGLLAVIVSAAVLIARAIR